jgi:hypothetical protein
MMYKYLIVNADDFRPGLHQGRIAESGSHEDLLELGRLYARLHCLPRPPPISDGELRAAEVGGSP